MIDQQPITDVRQEADRILARAREQGIPLRVLGGVAVALHCPSAVHRALQREYHDLDMMSLSPATREVETLFAQLGYQADAEFNKLHGQQRLYFWDAANERQVDVFLDVLRMSHSLDLRDRLALDERTLSLADLLLTKLQIFELNDKDVIDTIALLADHPLGRSDDETINLDRIVDVLSSDWGFYRTSKQTLERVRARLEHYDVPGEFDVGRQLDEIEQAVEQAPKSRAWRLRAIVGERKQWYELPEEVRRD